jgi:hypothetical protein
VIKASTYKNNSAVMQLHCGVNREDSIITSIYRPEIYKLSFRPPRKEYYNICNVNPFSRALPNRLPLDYHAIIPP